MNKMKSLLEKITPLSSLIGSLEELRTYSADLKSKNARTIYVSIGTDYGSPHVRLEFADYGDAVDLCADLHELFSKHEKRCLDKLAEIINDQNLPVV